MDDKTKRQQKKKKKMGAARGGGMHEDRLKEGQFSIIVKRCKNRKIKEAKSDSQEQNPVYSSSFFNFFSFLVLYFSHAPDLMSDGFPTPHHLTCECVRRGASQLN